MKIGIPRALYYHSYSYLWKTFFDNINIEYIISPPTNKNILKMGKDIALDETCLPIKIYLGHIAYLINKCDYILIPRYLGEEKTNLSCIKFNSLYDVICNTFKNINILNYNIDYTQNKDHIKELINLGITLGKTKKQSYNATLNAYKAYISYKQYNYIQQNKLLNNNNKKILILSHSYNIEDELIGKKIINILNKYNIDIILSSKYISNNDLSYKISKTLYWQSSKEILNALEYYKDNVDGIILLTSFPCGNDCLVNELIIRKLNNYKIINIVIDELNSDTGLITRLESFIDIINGITI